MFSNSPKKSFEIVDLVSREQGVAESTSSKDKHKCVALDDEEAWKKFFEMQNNSSTNTTNTKNPKPHIHKDNNGMFRYTAEDENKYNGKYIIGKVADEIRAEIPKFLGGDVAKSIVLKESKSEEGIIIPAARIVLSDSTKPINTSSLINSAICEKYGVGSVTFCLPDKNKTRGMRCRLDKDGTRIYEVANGSYNMTLNWYVEGKECKMKINISDDGSVKFIESNGVTWEQLAAHKEVKVGRQYEAKPLYEALSYLKQESSEIVEVSQQPSTSVTQPTKVENVKKTQEEKQKDTAQGVSR